MATEKQISMMAARAREAGIVIDRDSLKTMNNGDIDKFLDHCKVLKNHPSPEIDGMGDTKKDDFNGVRYGLALKLVFQDMGLREVQNNPEAYTHESVEVYKIMTEAENLARK